ncbi:hypothetical protein [Apilactobacillus kunkeei]|uniref:hypothetical protein n=1 Tax=Apilactobacillus kunkeei TaxID=148814 RepID=UPI00200A2D67|nr:hypothetical protein [Apilactobacillus kunkeei]MCK8626589.1 hypothetical protein [Apilactobacillus kunkeei]
MQIFNELYNAIGTVAVFTIIYFVIKQLRSKTQEESTVAPTAKQRKLWSDASNALEVLETVAKNYVAGLDKVDAPNSEKRKQAQVQLQAYADEHHIPVDVDYINGLVESKVNALRATQGLASGNNTDNGQTVTISSQQVNDLTK